MNKKSVKNVEFDDVTAKVNKLLGNRVKTQRKKMGKTQSDLAAVINKSVSSVQKYEDGSTEIPITVLLRISKYLEYPIEQMINSGDYKDIGGFLFFFSSNENDDPVIMHYSSDTANGIKIDGDIANDEKELLLKYHNLDKNGKESVLAILRIQYERCRTDVNE